MLRVCGLSGDDEVCVPLHHVSHLATVGELKAFLADRWPRAPPPCIILLQGVDDDNFFENDEGPSPVADGTSPEVAEAEVSRVVTCAPRGHEMEKQDQRQTRTPEHSLGGPENTPGKNTAASSTKATSSSTTEGQNYYVHGEDESEEVGETALRLLIKPPQFVDSVPPASDFSANAPPMAFLDAAFSTTYLGPVVLDCNALEAMEVFRQFLYWFREVDDACATSVPLLQHVVQNYGSEMVCIIVERLLRLKAHRVLGDYVEHGTTNRGGEEETFIFNSAAASTSASRGTTSPAAARIVNASYNEATAFGGASVLHLLLRGILKPVPLLPPDRKLTSQLLTYLEALLIRVLREATPESLNTTGKFADEEKNWTSQVCELFASAILGLELLTRPDLEVSTLLQIAQSRDRCCTCLVVATANGHLAVCEKIVERLGKHLDQKYLRVRYPVTRQPNVLGQLRKSLGYVFESSAQCGGKNAAEICVHNVSRMGDQAEEWLALSEQLKQLEKKG
ncbi:unnamed protein product [Amoebophrya sp. A120]|nr:unnamed protein product [Amoebophrya sp. A120]|eukprot:GSA120T00012737001.1